MLLVRAEVDFGLFRIMLYRRMLGEKQSGIYGKMLSAPFMIARPIVGNEREDRGSPASSSRAKQTKCSRGKDKRRGHKLA